MERLKEQPEMTEQELAKAEKELDEQIQRLRSEVRRLRKRNRQLKKTAEIRRKLEFSKLIFMGVSVLTISITLFSCRMIWQTQDTSALAYLIPAVFTEMAAATGFYFSKAKAENKIKLMVANGVKPEASDFET